MCTFIIDGLFLSEAKWCFSSFLIIVYEVSTALWSFALLFSESCLVLQYPFWDWVIRSVYSIPDETLPLIYIMALQYFLYYSPSYSLSFKTSCLLFLPQLSIELRSLMSFLQWYQTIFPSSQLIWNDESTLFLFLLSNVGYFLCTNIEFHLPFWRLPWFLL